MASLCHSSRIICINVFLYSLLKIISCVYIIVQCSYWAQVVISSMLAFCLTLICQQRHTSYFMEEELVFPLSSSYCSALYVPFTTSSLLSLLEREVFSLASFLYNVLFFRLILEWSCLHWTETRTHASCVSPLHRLLGCLMSLYSQIMSASLSYTFIRFLPHIL